MNVDRTGVKVGSYELALLRSVRCDDVKSFLGNGKGVYICSLPESDWFRHYKQKQGYNYAVEKKRMMFSNMASGSFWLSPTQDESVARTRDVIINGVLHIGHGALKGRIAGVVQTFGLVRWLIAHRREYEYVLTWNFDLPFYFAPLIARVLLGKKCYVDFEDDYISVRYSVLKNMITRVLMRTVAGAICIHESMLNSFAGKKTVVVNCFADLSYTKEMSASLKEGMVFVFGGRLDTIRGSDLLPELADMLRSHLNKFTIYVTGDGPLRTSLEAHACGEVRYTGFLDEIEYDRLLASADAFLVLQKPDHPFSKGSFPSKIQQYAAVKKPIFVLVEAQR